MKKHLILIFAALLLVSLTACGANTEEKYLQTSVTQEYIGKLTLRSESVYDETGSQTAFIQYRDGVEISRVEYTHGENEIIGTITQNGQTGSLRQKYEKDDAGNITKLEMYLDDVLHSVTESAYDANGNILNSTQKTISNGSEITTSTAYVYDAAGNPIRVTYEFDGVGTVTENSYDSAGKLVSAVTCDLLGHLTKREEHSWNETGAELVSTYNPAGDLISTTAHTYDEAGNVLTSETYDPEGNPVQRTIYTYQKFNIPIK